MRDQGLPLSDDEKKKKRKMGSKKTAPTVVVVGQHPRFELLLKCKCMLDKILKIRARES